MIQTIFLVIFPLALFVLLGWFCQYFKKINANAEQGLNFLLMNFSIPALLFHLIQHTPFKQFLYWRFLGCILLGLGLIFAVAFIIARARQQKFNQSIFSGLNASMLNSALIGIPLLLLLFGKQSSAPLILLNIAVGAIYLPLAIILLEYNTADNQIALPKIILNTLKKILSNPIIMSIPVGLLASYTQCLMPVSINTFIKMLSEIAAPLALIMVGMNINFKQGNINFDVLCLVTLKTIGLPLLMIVLAIWMQLPPIFAVCAVIGSALPGSKTVFLLSQKYQTGQSQSAMVVALSTLISLFTLPIFIIISLHLWPMVQVINIH